VKSCIGAGASVLTASLLWAGVALGDGSGEPTAVKDEDGKYFDKSGNPTYNVKPNGPPAVALGFFGGVACSPVLDAPISKAKPQVTVP
jgi:hypothetical protein